MLDWLTAAPPTKARLQGYKRIQLGGASYTIRRLAPSDFISSKPAIVPPKPTAVLKMGAQDIAKLALQFHEATLESMKIVVRLGLVEPNLADNKAGVTIEDIFRVPEHGVDLYAEIVVHSTARGQFAWLQAAKIRQDIRQLWDVASSRVAEVRGLADGPSGRA